MKSEDEIIIFYNDKRKKKRVNYLERGDDKTENGGNVEPLLILQDPASYKIMTMVVTDCSSLWGGKGRAGEGHVSWRRKLDSEIVLPVCCSRKWARQSLKSGGPLCKAPTFGAVSTSFL